MSSVVRNSILYSLPSVSLTLTNGTDLLTIFSTGTAADTEKTTDLISSKIRLHSLNTGRQPRVQTALRMLKQMLARYGGHIGAYLVLGGVDLTGPHLYTVHAAGSTDKLPYVSMGSGSLAAMATFETGFKPG